MKNKKILGHVKKSGTVSSQKQKKTNTQTAIKVAKTHLKTRDKIESR